MLVNSAGQRHFGFTLVARCAWADGKTEKKKFNLVLQFRIN